MRCHAWIPLADGCGCVASCFVAPPAAGGRKPAPVRRLCRRLSPGCWTARIVCRLTVSLLLSLVIQMAVWASEALIPKPHGGAGGRAVMWTLGWPAMITPFAAVQEDTANRGLGLVKASRRPRRISAAKGRCCLRDGGMWCARASPLRGRCQAQRKKTACGSGELCLVQGITSAMALIFGLR